MFKTLRYSQKADGSRTKTTKEFANLEDAKKYANRWSKNFRGAVFTSVEIWTVKEADVYSKCIYICNSKGEITEAKETEDSNYSVEGMNGFCIIVKSLEEARHIFFNETFKNTDIEYAITELTEDIRTNSLTWKKIIFKGSWKSNSKQIQDFCFDVIHCEDVYDNVQGEYQKQECKQECTEQANDKDIKTIIYYQSLMPTEETAIDEEAFYGTLDEAKVFANKRSREMSSSSSRIYAKVLDSNKLHCLLTHSITELPTVYIGSVEDKNGANVNSNTFETYEQARDFIKDNIQPDGWGYVSKGLNSKGYIRSPKKIDTIRYLTYKDWQKAGDFSYISHVGDIVDEAIVNEFLNDLPDRKSVV